MRVAFGLVGLLVAAGIVVMILSRGGGDYVSTVARSGQQATEQAQQLGGRSADGTVHFKDSLTIEPSTSGGRTVGLIVLSTDPNGPAATFYGLATDDVITAIGPLEVRSQVTGADDGIDFLTDAYQRRQPITVMRGDRAITLPSGAPPAAAATPDPTTPQPARAPPKDDRGSLQRQLDNITGAGQRPGGN